LEEVAAAARNAASVVGHHVVEMKAAVVRNVFADQVQLVVVHNLPLAADQVPLVVVHNLPLVADRVPSVDIRKLMQAADQAPLVVVRKAT